VNYELIAQYSEVIGGFAFLIVMVILFRKFLLPAVQAGEISRNADLVNAEGRREALRAEVAVARGEVEAATRDAIAIHTRAETDARHEHESILADARREGLRLLQNARGELDRGRIAGRDALRIELIELALNRARQLAAEQLNDASDAKLVTKTFDDASAGKIA
jgi:F0F1-type ATP synthase membrane subunit b/b'